MSVFGIVPEPKHEMVFDCHMCGASVTIAWQDGPDSQKTWEFAICPRCPIVGVQKIGGLAPGEYGFRPSVLADLRGAELPEDQR